MSYLLLNSWLPAPHLHLGSRNRHRLVRVVCISGGLLQARQKGLCGHGRSDTAASDIIAPPPRRGTPRPFSNFRYAMSMQTDVSSLRSEG